MARFLNLPLLDLTRGSNSIRQTPDEFDLSMIYKMKRENALFVKPSPPSNLKSITGRDTKGLFFDIPPAGINRRNITWMKYTWLIAISAMVFTGIYRWGHDIPNPDIYIFYATAGILFIMLPFLISIRIVWMSCRQRYRVRVDRSGFAFTKQGFFKKKVITIDPEKLQELKVYLPSKYLKSTYDNGNSNKEIYLLGYDTIKQRPARIIAISDAVTFEYGHGLSIEELEYILFLSKKELLYN